MSGGGGDHPGGQRYQQLPYKVVDRLEDHPIRRLFDAGVRVTINSDNMTCSRTNVNKELDLMRTLFGFTEEEIEKMEEYAWEARFLKD